MLALHYRQLSAMAAFTASLTCFLVDQEANSAEWLNEAESVLFSGLPYQVSYSGQLYQRSLELSRVREAYELSTGETREHLAVILAAMEIANKSSQSEKLAKIFREGQAELSNQVRAAVIDTVLTGSSPLDATIGVTRALNDRGLIRDAWRSNRERAEAMARAATMLQSSLEGLLENAAARGGQTFTTRPNVKLRDGEVGMVVQLSNKTPIKQPILLLEVYPQESNGLWTAINGLSILGGVASGAIDEDTAREGMELASAEEDSMNARRLFVIPLPAIPAKTCMIDVSNLNGVIRNAKEVKYTFFCEHGVARGAFADLSAVQQSIATRSRTGQGFPVTDFDGEYSHAAKPGESNLYPGALWKGTVKAVYTGAAGYRYGNLNAELVIDEVSDGVCNGRLRVGITKHNVSINLEDPRLSLTGLDPANTYGVRHNAALTGEWKGSLRGRRLTVARSVANPARQRGKLKETLTLTFKPARTEVK